MPLGLSLGTKRGRKLPRGRRAPTGRFAALAVTVSGSIEKTHATSCISRCAAQLTAELAVRLAAQRCRTGVLKKICCRGGEIRHCRRTVERHGAFLSQFLSVSRPSSSLTRLSSLALLISSTKTNENNILYLSPIKTFADSALGFKLYFQGKRRSVSSLMPLELW